MIHIHAYIIYLRNGRRLRRFSHLYIDSKRRRRCGPPHTTQILSVNFLTTENSPPKILYMQNITGDKPEYYPSYKYYTHVDCKIFYKTMPATVYSRDEKIKRPAVWRTEVLH